MSLKPLKLKKLAMGNSVSFNFPPRTNLDVLMYTIKKAFQLMKKDGAELNFEDIEVVIKEDCVLMSCKEKKINE